MIEEPVQYIEIDLDQCSLLWGNSPCTASLALNTANKCRNTWATCADRDNYSKGVLTLRFIKPRPKMPIDGRTFFHKLQSVSAFSNTVNIMGFKPELGGSLGRRATVTVDIEDFVYNDRYTDKYALERETGDAQFNGEGYNPVNRATFWTKVLKWSPNYNKRPIRVVDTFIYLDSGGTPVWGNNPRTRHYLIKNIKQNFNNNTVTIEGEDILTLAEKDSAVAPKVSTGSLLEDIDAEATTATLTPEGIGDLEYPTSGYARISSEIVEYTRVGDIVTFVTRGAEKTEVSSHSAEDTFQQAKKFVNTLPDEVLGYLLGETSIPSSFYDLAAYQEEAHRWGSTIQINTILSEPTAVIDYLGELSSLGVILWFDSVEQKIKFKLNHPPDWNEVATEVSDRTGIKSLTLDDSDDDRITQVHFYSVQEDPTEDADDGGNYSRVDVVFDEDAQDPNNYNETVIKNITCRWLNSGNSGLAVITSRRILQRFNTAPKFFNITLDSRFDVNLADLLLVTTRYITDDNGEELPTLLQVVGKSETRSGHEIKYTLQSYDFDASRAFIMENDANDYDNATEEELDIGMYIGYFNIM